MADPPKRTYSREEMMEILRRASEQAYDHHEDGIRHEELVAAAREAGLDPAAVENAAAELATSREAEEMLALFEERRRRSFWRHLQAYLVVNAFLFLLSLATGGSWFVFPLLGWGLGLAFHALSTMREPSPAALERLTRRERRKRAAEERREARRRAKEARDASERARRERRKSAEKELEHAVEEGVSALMSVIARRIESAARGSEPRPDSAFNRYVARQKAGPASPASAVPHQRTAGPNVRVDESADAEPAEEAEPLASAKQRARRP